MKQGHITALLIVGTIVVAVLVVGLIVSMRKQKIAEDNVAAMEEMIAYEKKQLEDEYTVVANEMADVHAQIDNDSLLHLLDKQQQRVQLLLEELRTTKVTDARRIAELKKELISVRSALTYYVSQVDSLHRINTRLTAENQDVKMRYDSVEQTARTLAEEKQVLTEKVTLASQLEATNISVMSLTERGKQTNRINKIMMIKVSLTLVKNITATVGDKILYLRITAPDGSVMGAPENTFWFEDRNIQYSGKKNFEYSGEECHEVIYWTVEQSLIKGTYRVDLFVDSHLIGSKEFTLN